MMLPPGTAEPHHGGAPAAALTTALPQQLGVPLPHAAGLAMQCNQRTAYDLLLRALKGEYVPAEAPPTTQVKFQASTVPTIVEETAETASQLQSI